MINNEAVADAKESINEEIGTLRDLPRELANTVANLYYKDACLYLDLLNKGPYAAFHSSKPIMEYIDDTLDSICMQPSVPKLIKHLRELKNTQIYDYTVELFLDAFKYKIKNVAKKSALRRRIERYFYKPDEILNLVDLIDNDEN